MIDSHAHLHSPEFDEDRADVIARARADGLALIIEVGTDLESSGRAVSLSVEYPDIIRAAVGVHPHDAADLTDDVLAELRAMASRPEVVAIGETGLDYYRDLSPREAQRQAFQAQLRLANEVELPAIVHDRDAHEDVLKIILESSRLGECKAVQGVLHCFSGSYAMARDAIEAGWYISVAGPVTYPSASRLRSLVARLPLDRVLVETDSPWLTPQPYRGKRNEPAHVRWVVEQIAEVKGVCFEDAALATSDNARRLFGLG